jgi:hypothetical protein
MGDCSSDLIDCCFNKILNIGRGLLAAALAWSSIYAIVMVREGNDFRCRHIDTGVLSVIWG